MHKGEIRRPELYWRNVNIVTPPENRMIMFKSRNDAKIIIGFFETNTDKSNPDLIGTFYEGYISAGLDIKKRGIGCHIWNKDGKIEQEVLEWSPIETPNGQMLKEGKASLTPTKEEFIG